MEAPGYWDNVEKSQEGMKELNILKEEKQKYDNKIKQIILAKDPYIKEEKSISNCIDLCKQYEKYGVEQIADIWAAMDLENIDETVQLKSEQMNLRKQIYDDARKYHAVNAEM